VPHDVRVYGACIFGRAEGHLGSVCMRNLTRRCRHDVTGIREVRHIQNEGYSQQTRDKIMQVQRGL
jgi:hypothetical protein